MTNSERRVQVLARAIPARAGIETWRLLTELAAKMGLKFKMNYTVPSQIFEEIRRVAPIYRYVEAGGQGPDAIWDATRSPMKAVALNGAATAPLVKPVPTGALDYLDARFERWFGGLFKDR
jgi:NADH dehydrogenase/NADH:ubiquinone oxidoreductase subunit G